MANIIYIKERGNRLFIDECYTPIVCGNSNYYLEFDFSDEWLKCNSKTALFLVETKKTLVAFEGTTCKIPALPNGPYVTVSLLTSNGKNEQLATTRLRLRLEPNPFNEPYKEDEMQKRYAAKIHGVINDIENGNIKVQLAETANLASIANQANSADFASNAEHSNTSNFATIAESSNTQVDLYNNQDVFGDKNFVGAVSKNNFPIVSTDNLFNKNLLINGSFRINQRGKSTYTEDNVYTVDRWFKGEGSIINKLDDGIEFVKTTTNEECFISYSFEPADAKNLSNKKITFSSLISNIPENTNYKICIQTNEHTLTHEGTFLSNNELLKHTFLIPENCASLKILFFPIYDNSVNTSVNIFYVKAELGEFATQLVCPPLAEELKTCQYYYRLFACKGVPCSTTELVIEKSLHDVRPVLTCSIYKLSNMNSNKTLDQSLFNPSLVTFDSTGQYFIRSVVPKSGSSATFSTSSVYCIYFYVDAEIY